MHVAKASASQPGCEPRKQMRPVEPPPDLSLPPRCPPPPSPPLVPSSSASSPSSTSTTAPVCEATAASPVSLSTAMHATGPSSSVPAGQAERRGRCRGDPSRGDPSRRGALPERGGSDAASAAGGGAAATSGGAAGGGAEAAGSGSRARWATAGDVSGRSGSIASASREVAPSGRGALLASSRTPRSSTSRCSSPPPSPPPSSQRKVTSRSRACGTPRRGSSLGLTHAHQRSLASQPVSYRATRTLSLTRPSSERKSSYNLLLHSSSATPGGAGAPANSAASSHSTSVPLRSASSKPLELTPDGRTPA
mmetsp:Transcript_39085/g.126351  ORF Transcript_39085/g.126351 Transcript_39085/m.126351 type:complete len:308 (-) Transcript_39085:758-1681(-)